MNTNDQPTSILIKKILTAPFTRVGSTGSGDSTLTLWQDAEGEQAIETNGDPVLISDYGFDIARRQILGGDYQDYTVTLATYSASTWIAANSENAKANARLAARLESQFPGIIIRLAQRGAITGPDSDIVARIDAFIDGLWLAVLSH